MNIKAETYAITGISEGEVGRLSRLCYVIIALTFDKMEDQKNWVPDSVELEDLSTAMQILSSFTGVNDQYWDTACSMQSEINQMMIDRRKEKTNA